MAFNNFLRNWGADVQTGYGEIRPLAFPYPVFGRFAYTPYALNGHFFWFFGASPLGGFCNVRSYHTTCARTAGHRISEKPEGGFRRSPSELVLGVDGGFFGLEN